MPEISTCTTNSSNFLGVGLYTTACIFSEQPIPGWILFQKNCFHLEALFLLFLSKYFLEVIFLNYVGKSPSKKKVDPIRNQSHGSCILC